MKSNDNCFKRNNNFSSYEISIKYVTGPLIWLGSKTKIYQRSFRSHWKPIKILKSMIFELDFILPNWGELSQSL